MDQDSNSEDPNGRDGGNVLEVGLAELADGLDMMSKESSASRMNPKYLALATG